jgi:hypothetical protein
MSNQVRPYVAFGEIVGEGDGMNNRGEPKVILPTCQTKFWNSGLIGRTGAIGSMLRPSSTNWCASGWPPLRRCDRRPPGPLEGPS